MQQAPSLSSSSQPPPSSSFTAPTGGGGGRGLRVAPASSQPVSSFPPDALQTPAPSHAVTTGHTGNQAPVPPSTAVMMTPGYSSSFTLPFPHPSAPPNSTPTQSSSPPPSSSSLPPSLVPGQQLPQHAVESGVPLFPSSASSMMAPLASPPPPLPAHPGASFHSTQHQVTLQQAPGILRTPSGYEASPSTPSLSASSSSALSLPPLLVNTSQYYPKNTFSPDFHETRGQPLQPLLLLAVQRCLRDFRTCSRVAHAQMFRFQQMEEEHRQKKRQGGGGGGAGQGAEGDTGPSALAGGGGGGGGGSIYDGTSEASAAYRASACMLRTALLQYCRHSREILLKLYLLDVGWHQQPHHHVVEELLQEIADMDQQKQKIRQEALMVSDVPSTDIFLQQLPFSVYSSEHSEPLLGPGWMER